MESHRLQKKLAPSFSYRTCFHTVKPTVIADKLKECDASAAVNVQMLKELGNLYITAFRINRNMTLN